MYCLKCGCAVGETDRFCTVCGAELKQTTPPVKAAPQASATGNGNSFVYCKHCYRMMDAGTDICPACGKSQHIQSANKAQSKKVTWFLICFILGLLCMSSFPFVALLLLGAAVVLAVNMITNKKATENTLVHQMPIVTPTIPVAPKDSEKDGHISAQAEAIVKALQEDTIRQAYGDEFADNFLTDDIEDSNSDLLSAFEHQENNPTYIAKTYKAVGMPYRMDALMELACENSDYHMSKAEIIDELMTDQKIWKYEFYPSKVELVPEPENPTDPNAIKVIVDGKHIAYIKKGSCAHLLKLIKADGIRNISCTIGGGPYKSVYEEYDFEIGDNVYQVERDTVAYSVRLTVHEIKT